MDNYNLANNVTYVLKTKVNQIYKGNKNTTRKSTMSGFPIMDLKLNNKQNSRCK